MSVWNQLWKGGEELVKKMLEPSIDSVHYIQVCPRLYITALASETDEHVLSHHLHKNHPGTFFIYNLSAHRVLREAHRHASSKASGSLSSTAAATSTATSSSSTSSSSSSSSSTTTTTTSVSTSAAKSKTVSEGESIQSSEKPSVSTSSGNSSANPPGTVRSLDPADFDDQVLEFSLPHHPSPLEALIDLALAISSWLRADPRHIAVIHSLSAGRAAMASAIAAVFSGMHESGNEALDAVGLSHGRYLRCTNPGQTRYVRYAQDALFLGGIPNTIPLAITRIKVQLPRGTPSDSLLIVQIVKGRQILFSSEWESDKAPDGSNAPVDGSNDGGYAKLKDNSGESGRSKSQAVIDPWKRTDDGWRELQLCAGVVGDAMIRAYEVPRIFALSGDTSEHRRSLFRFVFNTGFLVPGDIRVAEDQLDDARPGTQIVVTLESIKSCPELDGDVGEYLEKEATRSAAKVASAVGEIHRRDEHDAAAAAAAEAAATAEAAAKKEREREKNMSLLDVHRNKVTASESVKHRSHGDDSSDEEREEAEADARAMAAATMDFPMPPTDPVTASSSSLSNSAETEEKLLLQRADPLAALGPDLFVSKVIMPNISSARDAANAAMVSHGWMDAISDYEDLWSGIARSELRGPTSVDRASRLSSEVVSLSDYTNKVAARARENIREPSEWKSVPLTPSPSSSVTALHCSRDGIIVAGCDDGAVHVWWNDAGQGGEGDSYESHDGRHTARVTCVAIVSDSRWNPIVASGSDDTTIALAGRGSAETPRCLASHIADITAIVPCGRDIFASAGSDYMLNLWSIATGELIWSVQEPVSVTAPPFLGIHLTTSMTLKAIVYGDDECPSLHEYRLATGKPVNTPIPITADVSEDLDAVNLAGIVGDKVQLCGGGYIAAADDGCVRISVNLDKIGEVSAPMMECFDLHAPTRTIFVADGTGMVATVPAVDVVGEIEAELKEIPGSSSVDPTTAIAVSETAFTAAIAQGTEVSWIGIV